MNAKLTVKILALGLLATEVTKQGLEIPAELDAEIDELIELGDIYAGIMSDYESDAAIIETLAGMVGAIKGELEAVK